LKEAPSFMNWGFEPQDKELYIYSITYLDDEWPQTVHNSISILNKEDLLDTVGNPNYKKDNRVNSWYYPNGKSWYRLAETQCWIYEQRGVEELELERVRKFIIKMKNILNNLDRWVDNKKPTVYSYENDYEFAENRFTMYFIANENYISFTVSEGYDWENPNFSMNAKIRRLNL
jgi:hypothetical protein